MKYKPSESLNQPEGKSRGLQGLGEEEFAFNKSDVCCLISPVVLCFCFVILDSISLYSYPKQPLFKRQLEFFWNCFIYFIVKIFVTHYHTFVTHYILYKKRIFNLKMIVPGSQITEAETSAIMRECLFHTQVQEPLS